MANAALLCTVQNVCEGGPQPASVSCDECAEVMCVACDVVEHATKKTKCHVRLPLAPVSTSVLAATPDAGRSNEPPNPPGRERDSTPNLSKRNPEAVSVSDEAGAEARRMLFPNVEEVDVRSRSPPPRCESPVATADSAHGSNADSAQGSDSPTDHPSFVNNNAISEEADELAKELLSDGTLSQAEFKQIIAMNRRLNALEDPCTGPRDASKEGTGRASEGDREREKRQCTIVLSKFQAVKLWVRPLESDSPQ